MRLNQRAVPSAVLPLYTTSRFMQLLVVFFLHIVNLMAEPGLLSGIRVVCGHSCMCDDGDGG